MELSCQLVNKIHGSAQVFFIHMWNDRKDSFVLIDLKILIIRKRKKITARAPIIVFETLTNNFKCF